MWSSLSVIQRAEQGLGAGGWVCVHALVSVVRGRGFILDQTPFTSCKSSTVTERNDGTNSLSHPLTRIALSKYLSNSMTQKNAKNLTYGVIDIYCFTRPKRCSFII